jgi:putative membrane-bound dehydrogenase-like protein
MKQQVLTLAALILFSITSHSYAASDVIWEAGVAKRDITPQQPIRLSGYASRSTPTVGVSDSIFVRSLALIAKESQPADPQNAWSQRFILVSVDSIGLPESVTLKILAKVREKTLVQRSEIVFCASHSHTTPHLIGGLTNLFAEDMPADHLKVTTEYTEFFISQIAEAILESLSKTAPAELWVGQGEANFGTNRRVLANRAWAGAGNPPDGVRDPSVPILGVKDASGKLLSVAYDYACHCTSISPDINKISGDWAGISAATLEKLNPGIVALPVIGCGADINPNPRGTTELSQRHGNELASIVDQVIKNGLSPLPVTIPEGTTKSQAINAHFGFAGLAPERPSRETLVTASQGDSAHRRRWAQNMLAIWDRMGRIPETYPAPIHTWRIGNALTWVFLSGEVVCDYQIRLKKELQSERVWVTAYTDDCFGYLASERMRSEGGYEVDDSMIYYNQPGRWQSGTEDLVVRRVKEIIDQPLAEDRALEPAEALKSMHVPEGWTVDLIAAEPLIDDPVHLAFDAKGRLWVVEMRDYPEGNNGRGGCIKILEDTNGDAVMDKVTLFLDGLAWPNGVYPWRDGAVVSCAPDIFFAKDTDGDGMADEKKVLATGFPEANPQHRVNGFSYSLNHELHFSSGDSVDTIAIPGEKKQLKVAGRDLILNVDRGSMELTTGTSQYGRARDNWENWFGNSNSFPMFHFVIEESYLRSSSQPIESTTQQMFEPAISPPVFPASRTVDRFNDLWTANRFTSACSSIIVRDNRFDVDGSPSLLVCEPVHNLIHRSLLRSSGSTFQAKRAPGEEQTEWFRSSDPWSRPVFVESAPDGSMLVVDMYRQFIEHTEWIPLSWQERIDVRAGEGRGRIYRVRRKDQPAQPLPNLTLLSMAQLVEQLQSPSGTLRDLAMQQLIWRYDGSAESLLRSFATSDAPAENRVAAWGVLKAVDALRDEDIAIGVADRDHNLRSVMLRWSESAASSQGSIKNAVVESLNKVASENISPRLALQYVLTTGRWDDATISAPLTALITRFLDDKWIMVAASMIHPVHDSALARTMLTVLDDSKSDETQRNLAAQWLARWLASNNKEESRQFIADVLLQKDFTAETDSRTILLGAAWLRSYQKESLEKIPEPLKKALPSARERISDPALSPAVKIAWIQWLGTMDEQASGDMNALTACMTSDNPVEVRRAALNRLRVLPDRSTADRLIAVWPKLGAELQANLLNTLTSKPSWAISLLQAIAATKVPITDLDPATISSLRGHPNETIRNLSDKLFGQSENVDREKLVATILPQLNANPDPAKGELIYRKQCAACHQGSGDSNPIGPNLGALTDKSNPALLMAVLHPNKAIEAKYKQRLLNTVDGETVRGVVIQENASGVTLGLSDGTKRTFPRDDIENSRDLNLSLMPEGFEKTLSQEELADVLKFLQTVDFATFK